MTSHFNVSKVWSAFWISLFYVAGLANAALATAEDAAIALNLSRVVAGATILAAGAQIPDVMGSMAMSRQVQTHHQQRHLR